MPAAAVIPAPIAYINFAAVKKLVVRLLYSVRGGFVPGRGRVASAVSIRRFSHARLVVDVVVVRAVVVVFAFISCRFSVLGICVCVRIYSLYIYISRGNAGGFDLRRLRDRARAFVRSLVRPFRRGFGAPVRSLVTRVRRQPSLGSRITQVPSVLTGCSSPSAPRGRQLHCE